VGVRLLTPAGTGAIAVVEAVDAWAVVRGDFRPASGKSLPEAPAVGQSWFGRFADDEVILLVTAINPIRVEIHAHGGTQIVSRIVNSFASHGRPVSPLPLSPAAFAPTLRTASILLDQSAGAFDRDFANGHVDRLLRRVSLGKHLIEPWRIALAGPPNAGKSSLLNAMAGYERSLVSPVAGTTRDVVTARTAFDGWPVELIDTAGLRTTDHAIEAEGVQRANAAMNEADFVVWLVDGDAETPLLPVGRADTIVVSKADRPARFDRSPWPTISAATGEGLPTLIRTIVDRLVPDPPLPGEGVPFLPDHFSRLGLTS
jgi:tRNA modification GTPase